MRIYLIRHGRQCSSLCNINVKLAKEGVMQAKLTGERLEKYNIDRIYSSDLIRAMETAEIINNILNVPHIVKEELREISFGEMEGLEDDVIKEKFGDFIAERNTFAHDIPYPGGECGKDVFERAMPVLKEIINSGDENVVVVTHGGLIRAVLAGVMGKGFENKLYFGKDLENCSITELRYESAIDKIYIERFNDYAHLECEPKLLRRYFKKGF